MGWDGFLGMGHEQSEVLTLFSPLDIDESMAPAFHVPLAQATLEYDVLSQL